MLSATHNQYLQRNIEHVKQGDFAVSDDLEQMMTAVLGSCVAVCLYDPVKHVGGMNHFLLPKSSSTTDSSGLHMMELLINGLLRMGAERGRLQAKLFGGANMMHGLSDIGTENAEFARNFLSYEGIPNVGESLGGDRARRVRFWPTTGKARQKIMSETTIVKEVEPVVIPQAPELSTDDDLELF